MSRIAKLTFLFALAGGVTTSAFAGVTVNSPYNGEQVGSPFTLSANASNCSSQAISAMGYSFDNSPNTTFVYSSAINASVQSGLGNHTLHVKAWGNKGAGCVTDIALNVTTSGSTSSGSSSSGSVPWNAVSVSSLQALGNWKAEQDSAVTGYATGGMALVNNPSYGGTAREFWSEYKNYGGERFHVTFGDDTSSMNFLYDTWIYLTDSASNIANIEMDMNQVMPNGQTVIYGFQCDGWTGTWDYTANGGTPWKPVDKWLHSKQACSPSRWSRNAWHHVQISYSRDNSGYVTYHAVWLDGAEQQVNATVPSAFALGWGPSLITNFQVDEAGSALASSTVYLDNMTIYRW